MTTHHQKVADFLNGLLTETTPEELAGRLLPDEAAITARLTRAGTLDAAQLDRRWRVLGERREQVGNAAANVEEKGEPRADPLDAAREELLDARTAGRLGAYAANIENFVGTVEMPVGVAGPLRVRGVHARGDYFLPLATTEAALVASCTRGAQVVSLAGGCRSAVVAHGVTRSPAFAFADLAAAGRFVHWVVEHTDPLRRAAEQTTAHGQLTDLRVHIEGNHVYLICEYTTGEASGQNMVTLATEALCERLLADCPVQPRTWYLEGNFSSDKKASAMALQSVRGRKVVSEAVLPAELIQRRLHTDPTAMADYWRLSSLGGVSSGAIGVQGHYANILAAIYIALGQDAACVAESAVGITRFERTEQGDLYVAVTLPAVMVGTVGGGTRLPSARACFDLLNLPDDHPADALAELVGGAALSAEVSLIAALAAGQFGQAHRQLARERRVDADPPTE